jgi:hypothetical protein
MPAAPKGVRHKSIGSGFVAFLGLLGQCADPDGVNRKPPGTAYIVAGIRVSRDSVSRYWRAAEMLGVIDVERSVSGRYVYRYSLKTVPEWALNWAAAEAELTNYKQLQDKQLTESESVHTDSPAQDAESVRHDSPQSDPQQASPDVRHPRVLTYGNGNPDVMTRPGRDQALDHEMADVVGPQHVRAREVEQPGIPAVEQEIVPVPVRRRPLIDRMKRRSDEEITRLVLFGRSGELTAWEQSRYAEMAATPYSPWNTSSVGAPSSEGAP